MDDRQGLHHKCDQFSQEYYGTEQNGVGVWKTGKETNINELYAGTRCILGIEPLTSIDDANIDDQDIDEQVIDEDLIDEFFIDDPHR